MKKLIILVVLLITTQAKSQEIKPYLIGGYVSAEVGVVKETEGLNFGFSFSMTDSKFVEDRAIKYDIFNKNYEVHTKYVPAVFGLVGATFDDFTMTGKVGTAYLEQSIQGKPESQKFYLAVGIILDYKGFLFSFDNVNSLGLGYKFNL